MRLAFIAAAALLAVLAAAAIIGCSDRTEISSIIQDPDRYIGKEVTVGGEVTRSMGVDLVVAEVGAYQIDDGTGKIWVITRAGVPREGTKVGLKGTVEGGFRFGRETLGTVIREERRKGA